MPGWNKWKRQGYLVILVADRRPDLEEIILGHTQDRRHLEEIPQNARIIVDATHHRTLVDDVDSGPLITPMASRALSVNSRGWSKWTMM